MKILALLIVFVVYFFLKFDWQKIQKKLKSNMVVYQHRPPLFANSALVFSVFAPTLLLSLLIWLTHPSLHLLIGIAVLLIAMGSNQYSERLLNIIDLAEKDETAQALAQASNQFFDEAQQSPQLTLQWQAKINERFITLMLTRVFNAIFWFMLFGPVGALFVLLLNAYVEAQQASEQGEQASLADTLLHAISWLPARLLGITFALVGDFTNCFHHWFKDSFEFEQSQCSLLTEYAYLAIGLQHQLGAQSQQVVLLLKRSVIVWIMIIALLVIFQSH